MRIALCCAEDFNFGIGYLSAFLKKRGDIVRLFFYPYKEVEIEDVKDFKPDLVGISCVTANSSWVYALANRINDNINCPVVLGGVHPTLCPEEAKAKGFEPCIGDGFKYFGGEFNPDEIWCDREIFWKVLPPIHRKVQMFMTGFGCPFKCSYCNNHQLHRRIIKRDYINCIKELEYLKANGMKYVLFDDDIFTLDKSWLKKFLAIYAHTIELPFTCFGHPKYIDNEICSMLKKAKCQMVWFGIQTGDEWLRKTILNRPETNEELRQAITMVKKHGIKVMIDHIFGIPYENEYTIRKSYNFYKSLKPDVVNCYEMLYFPKAEINKYGWSKAKYQKEGGENYKKYVKAFTSIPLGKPFRFLPLWFIKGLTYIKAKRVYIIRIVIENMIYFKWRTIWKRLMSLDSLRKKSQITQVQPTVSQ